MIFGRQIDIYNTLALKRDKSEKKSQANRFYF